MLIQRCILTAEEIKIKVRENLFCVFAASFIGFVVIFVLQRRSHAFKFGFQFQSKPCAFSGNIFEFHLTQSAAFSSVAQWCGRLPGVQAVRVQATFFLFISLFFLGVGEGAAAVVVCFFIASFCFSFISTAHPIIIKNELP